MNAMSGSAVTQWIGFMERFYAEIEALNDQLSNSLAHAIADSGDKLGCVAHGKIESEFEMDESGNLYVGYAYDQALKKSRRSKNPERWLGWQISLSGAGVAIPGSDAPEPLMHVYCWNAGVDFDEVYIGFPLDSCGESRPKLHDDCLVIWGDPEGAWNEREWMYSLRLFSLKSPGDLDDLVVKPALGLLRGGGAAEHLGGVKFSEALIRYPSIQLLTGTG